MTPAFNYRYRGFACRSNVFGLNIQIAFQCCSTLTERWPRIPPPSRMCESMSFHYYLLRKIDHPQFLTFLSTSTGRAVNVESCRIEAITCVIYYVSQPRALRIEAPCAYEDTPSCITSVINIQTVLLCRQHETLNLS